MACPLGLPPPCRSFRVCMLLCVGKANATMTCVRFADVPPQPPSWHTHPVVFATRSKLIRLKAENLSFELQTTERLMDAEELRRRFRGIIFVGDSQLREVAWAALMLLASNRTVALQKGRLPASDGKRMRPLSLTAAGDQCLPHWIGKLGFSATCTEQPGSPCQVNLPFDNRMQESQRTRQWLHFNGSADGADDTWDGRLSAVDDGVCVGDGGHSSTFVSYQGTYHDGAPIDPYSIPACLHEHLEARSRRILWVISGSALHQRVTCSSIQLRLPQHVLSKFPPSILRDSLVWQPAGGGFLPLASEAAGYGRECRGKQPSIDAIAKSEKEWLDSQSIRYYDYTAIVHELAPLMLDGKHFVHYFTSCHEVFPRVADMISRVALNLAVGRPLRFCTEAPANGTCVRDCLAETCDRWYCWGKGTVYRPWNASGSLESHEGYMARGRGG